MNNFKVRVNYTLAELEDKFFNGEWVFNYDLGYKYAKLLLKDQYEGQWLSPESYLSY